MVSTVRAIELRPAAPTEHTRSLLNGALQRFFARRLVVLGVILVVVLIFIGVFGRLLAPYNPVAQDLINVLSPPTSKHWFGTDELGRDTLSRLLWGATTSLQVSASINPGRKETSASASSRSAGSSHKAAR